MASMKNAPVDEAGTTLAYIDSGPPASDSYVTVVLIHGLSYTAQTFARLLPRASTYNLRIIAFNRRDYVNSTPLSASELSLLFSREDSDHKRYLRARGLEVARFLEWVIDVLKVPPAESIRVAGGLENSGVSKGGIALIGWSLGSVTTLAFLRHLPSFPPDLIKKLESYLKTFIIYESSGISIGYPAPRGAYHPVHDSSLTTPERAAAFNVWASSYFTHPYYNSPSVGSENLRKLEQLSDRPPEPNLHESTEHAESSAATMFKPPSHANIDPEAFAATVDPIPAERSEVAIIGIVRIETLYDQLSGAILLPSSEPPRSHASDRSNEEPGKGSNEVSLVLPDLRTLYIHGTRSIWGVPCSVWSIEADLAARPTGVGRLVELVRVEGSNHFWHWDEPDEFLSLISEKCGKEVKRK